MDILSRKEFLSLKIVPSKDVKYTKSELDMLNRTFLDNLSGFKLYSYQLFVVRYFSLYNNVKRILIKWGTGAGKTKTSLACAHQFLSNGCKKVFILGPTKDIFIQEIIKDPNFGITSKELLKELEYLKGTDEYFVMFNRLKRSITYKGYEFISFEKFYNDLFNYKGIINSDQDLHDKIASGVITVNKILLDSLRNSLIIMDEFHNLYNSKEKNSYGVAVKYVLDELKNDIYCMCLSATLSNNDPTEIIDVASIIDYTFKGSKNEYFEDRDGINVLKKGAIDKLHKVFFGKVSFFETRTLDLYPEQIFVGETIKVPKDNFGNTTIPYLKFVRCQMRGVQLQFYNKFYTGTIPNDQKYVLDYCASDGCDYVTLRNNKSVKVMGDNFTISFKDPGDNSAKYRELLNNIKVQGKKLIYHPDINVTGVLMIQELLINNYYTPYGSYPNDNSICKECFKAKIQHKGEHEFKAAYFILVDGNMSRDLRTKYFNIFSYPNNKEGDIIDILIGSQVIEESIDIKALRHIFVMKSPKNIGTLMQLFGRGIRNASHIDLPKKDRNVKIYLFVVSVDKELSYEENKYYIMMTKFLVNVEINTMLDNCALDLWVNQDIMINEGNPLADKYDRVVYTPKKVDDRFYNIMYKEWEISNLESLISAIFKISPVWKLNDLVKEIKNTPIKIHFNPTYVDDNNILIALSNLTDLQGYIAQYGDYFVRSNTISYNFLSDPLKKYKMVNLSEELDTKLDYEQVKKEFYKENRDVSVQGLAFNQDKYSRKFHIAYAEEIIEYLFGVLDGKKQHEQHDFMMKVLYFYDKFHLIIYASQVESNEYDRYILKNNSVTPEDKYKTLLYTSLENSLSTRPVFTKFNDLLNKKKLNPDVLPVGHFLDKRVLLYHVSTKKWSPYVFKEIRPSTKLSDIVVGYFERGNKITFEFKLKFPNEVQSQDKRTQKKGVKCKSLAKEEINKLIHKLDIVVDNKNISSLCDLIRKELIRRELKNDGTKWFFFHFEKIPW